MRKKIVGYELDHNKEAIAQIVANAINFVNQQFESIVINLNQVDFENLKFVLAERWQNFADIELKANNNIRRGDCLIETEIGIIEVNLGAQLEQIMQILLGKIS